MIKRKPEKQKVYMPPNKNDNYYWTPEAWNEFQTAKKERDQYKKAFELALIQRDVCIPMLSTINDLKGNVSSEDYKKNFDSRIAEIFSLSQTIQPKESE